MSDATLIEALLEWVDQLRRERDEARAQLATSLLYENDGVTPLHNHDPDVDPCVAGCPRYALEDG